MHVFGTKTEKPHRKTASSICVLARDEDPEGYVVFVDVKNILRVWSKHFTETRDNPCHIPYSLLVIQIQNNVNQDIFFKQLGLSCSV